MANSNRRSSAKHVLPREIVPLKLYRCSRNRGRLLKLLRGGRFQCGASACRGGPPENDGFIAVKQDAVLHVGANGSRKDNLFQITTFANKVFDGVAMRDSNHVLLDDWTIVENLGDVVARGTDQLNAALKGLMIRPRSDESGKKGMVDVDDALRITVDKVIRQNLHVACQHHEVRLVLVDEGLNPGLGQGFILFRHADDFVGNFVEIGDGLVVRMVGDDEWNVAGKFSALLAVKQVDQAVIILRDEDDHFGTMSRPRQPPLHAERLGNRGEVSCEIAKIRLREVDVEVFGIELDAHQEEPGFFVAMFVGVQDVSAMAVDEVGDGGDFSLAVGARDEQDGGGFHRCWV